MKKLKKFLHNPYTFFNDAKGSSHYLKYLFIPHYFFKSQLEQIRYTNFELKKHIIAINVQLKDVKLQMSNIQLEIEALKQKQDEHQRLLQSGDVKLANQATQIETLKAYSTQHLLNAKTYQPFMRQISAADIESILCITKTYNIATSNSKIRYLAAKLSFFEMFFTGRLAANIQDVMLCIFMARALQKDTLEILEIGTLFGIRLGMMQLGLMPHFSHIHYTVIDPLSGYYNKDPFDISTDAKVDVDTLKKNFAKAEILPENYTIINKYSQDEAAFAQASGKLYDMMIIDGDHSYQGIKSDCEIYIPLLSLGGLLVVDDYQTTAWPDVDAYINEVLMHAANLEQVASISKTIIFKKIA